jgi:hypothetical protein
MAETLVANAMIPLPYADGETPDNPNLARLQQKVLQAGETVPSGAFSKEELEGFKASGAVVPKSAFVTDEEKFMATSVSSLEAYQMGKQAAYIEENPDATEEEIDAATGAVIPVEESAPAKNRTTNPGGKNADQ